MRRALMLFVLLCAAVPAAAQTIAPGDRLGPTSSLRITWPATVPVDPSGLDVPDGYAVRAVNPTTTGVVIKEWKLGNVTAWTMTGSDIPAGAFSVSVHPYNIAGVSPASNVVGPFGKAAIPPRISTGVSAAVVGAP